jgi:hypothetical protein
VLPVLTVVSLTCRYDGTLVGCAVYSFLSMSSTEYVEPSLSNRGRVHHTSASTLAVAYCAAMIGER